MPTPRELPPRLDTFFDLLADEGRDGAILNNRDDIFYLTGYTGDEAVVVLHTRKRRGWLVTDARYGEEAEKSAPALETLLWKKGFAASVGRMLAKCRFKSVAFTPATLTVAFFDAMRAVARDVEKWSDVGPVINHLRAVKSRSEVKAIQAALACAEAAFTAARTRWRIGMREIEVKNDLEWEMRRRGADDTAFETIVAAGPNASLPHAHAGNGKIRPGSMLLIDFGAKLNRYHSDLTRTLWAERVPPLWRKRYQLVVAAQEAGIAAIRAGVSGRVPDAAARNVFAEAGVDKQFTHSLGHGVGLAVHENPRLGRLATEVLEAGQIVTVEPGLYFPGAGGIRVEDMALVQKNGARILSSLPKDEASLLITS